MKLEKKFLIILLTLTMVITMVPMFGVEAHAAVAESDTTVKVGDYTIVIPKGATIPEGVNENTPVTVVTDQTSWTSGWYVVTGASVEINQTVTVSGSVHLILKDGCKLTINGSNVNAGIYVSGNGNSLTIYGQNKGDGKLNVTSNNHGTGIYGYENAYITINGGIVEATGTTSNNTEAEGIWLNQSHLTINGGYSYS